ncbi:type I secretion system permease/ATPase [Ideonella sp. A 288]|uniref:type I secretion system permease/ATPase n=1 Tax=Ideonella sp. A 288 TaxID=1962181 RepID=UPI000B4BB899|nr:type I secretion system permease/ATPase [Ideonella sp. A 288]
MKKASSTRPPQAPGTEVKALILGQRALFMQALRLSVVIGALMLVPSWYMFEVYGRVLNSRNVMTLVWLSVAAVGVYVVLELLEIARSRILFRAAQSVDRQLTPRVFDACFEANLRKQPGGTTQALSDVRAVCDFIPSPAVTGAMDVPASLLCLVLLYLMSPWLGLMAALGALLQAGLGLVQERRTSPPYGEAMQASIEAQNRATGTLRNAQVIESMGMEGAMYQRWMASQRRFLQRLSQASDQASVASAAAKMIQNMQGSLLLGLATWLMLGNNLLGGGGMVIVASILGGRVLAPLAQLVGQWRQIASVRSAYARVSALLTHVPQREPGMELPAPKGVLTVEAVYVSPPASQAPVLKGVSFQVAPGEALMVIGPSAAGKSTLARVLIGVWPAQGGKVRLDGADVYAWHKSQLGPHIGYLPQGVELFDGTIAENIARFGKVDMALVRQAADEVGITAMIEQLPQGFETAIGDEGAVLSGGQRQRIGLARAIYGQPRLVVLDEPNSSLDEAGDKALLDLMQRLKSRGTTLIAITHRSSVLPAADKLLLLTDGTVGAFGPRDDVLAAMKEANEKARGRTVQLPKPAFTAPAPRGGAA